MNTSIRFRRGIEEASRNTGISLRQASIKSGYNENQLNRFVAGKTDIKLITLDTICNDGFNLTFMTVHGLGSNHTDENQAFIQTLYLDRAKKLTYAMEAILRALDAADKPELVIRDIIEDAGVTLDE